MPLDIPTTLDTSAMSHMVTLAMDTTAWSLVMDIQSTILEREMLNPTPLDKSMLVSPLPMPTPLDIPTTLDTSAMSHRDTQPTDSTIKMYLFCKRIKRK